MYLCDVCGQLNRPGARFCRYCASPLPSTPAPAQQPESVASDEEITAPLTGLTSQLTPDDERWLAATLAQDESSSAMSQSASPPTPSQPTPQGDTQEDTMEQSRPATPSLFGGRYELIAEDAHGHVEAVDHEPWRRCWACDSRDNQPGDAFCTNCGATLEKRSYMGSISPTSVPDALALITKVKDEFARAVLPPIWDRVEEEGHLLVLLEPEEHSPVELPLDELMSLRIGAGLARLLTVLHQRGLALGKIAPDHLGMTVEGQPRLLQVASLRRTDGATHADAVREDLNVLAELLEALADMPRTTQRLREDDVDVATLSAATDAEEETGFVAVLRHLRTSKIKDASALAERLEALLVERTHPQALRQLFGASSHTGIVRDHNEDSLLTLSLNLNNTSNDLTRGLYIVADGMGGHAAGEVASGMAVRAAAEVVLREYMTGMLAPEALYDERKAMEIVGSAVLHANEAVRDTGVQNNNDMGTTITMAMVIGDRAIIANVGDSRTYLYRDGKLRRISQDHSLVMRLVELGQISEHDIYTHPQRNAVLRSLGDQTDIEVDLFEERLRPGDTLLLCSDGQWEMTHDAEMEHILETHASADVQQVCEELIKAANQAGGEDNITSILVRFVAM